MTRWRSTLTIGGLMASLLLAPSAHAADGRIAFSGMILEPTCSVGADITASVAGAAGAGISRGGCGQGRAGGGAGSRYGLAVTTLAADRQADQLLSYLAGNAEAVGATARLLTRTYE